MRKHFIMIMLICAALANSPVFSALPDQCFRVPLSVRILDPKSLGSTTPRCPAQTPIIWMSGHTLQFGDFGQECTLEIFAADGYVCYSTVILPGDTSCELPPSLSGTYTIVLKMENVEYWGEIII